MDAHTKGLNGEPATFTARRIAEILGRSRQSTFRALDGISPHSVQISQGGKVYQYTLSQLPGELSGALETAARRLGYASAEELLLHPPDDAPLSAELSQVSSLARSKAQQLQRALRPSLERLTDPCLSSAERERLGIEEYRTVFDGRGISARQFRRFISRTSRRDLVLFGGARDWSRLELFLDDRPGRVDGPNSISIPEAGIEFLPLRTVIKSFRDPANPTPHEAAGLFIDAFGLLEELVGEGRPARKTKRRLINYLWKQAPFLLASSLNGLRVAFNRKYAAWLQSGGDPIAILDGRNMRRGLPVAEPISAADKIEASRIILTPNMTRKKVSAGLRELAEKGELSGLSENTQNLLTAAKGSKYHFNRRLRNAVTPIVKVVRPYGLDSQAISDATASLDVDYSHMSSMDAVTADDFTMPVYFWVPDGTGWFTMTRGQVLVFMDVRSRCILVNSLQPERNYDALTITDQSLA